MKNLYSCVACGNYNKGIQGCQLSGTETKKLLKHCSIFLPSSPLVSQALPWDSTGKVISVCLLINSCAVGQGQGQGTAIGRIAIQSER